MSNLESKTRFSDKFWNEFLYKYYSHFNNSDIETSKKELNNSIPKLVKILKGLSCQEWNNFKTEIGCNGLESLFHPFTVKNIDIRNNPNVVEHSSKMVLLMRTEEVSILEFLETTNDIFEGIQKVYKFRNEILDGLENLQNDVFEGVEKV